MPGQYVGFWGLVDGEGNAFGGNILCKYVAVSFSQGSIDIEYRFIVALWCRSLLRWSPSSMTLTSREVLRVCQKQGRL